MFREPLEQFRVGLVRECVLAVPARLSVSKSVFRRSSRRLRTSAMKDRNRACALRRLSENSASVSAVGALNARGFSGPTLGTIRYTTAKRANKAGFWHRALPFELGANT
jgi:hypothetical protein